MGGFLPSLSCVSLWCSDEAARRFTYTFNGISTWYSESLREFHHARSFLASHITSKTLRANTKFIDFVHIVKPKVTPWHAYAGTHGRYSSDPFAASALEVGGWSAPLPGRFTTGERPGIPCTGGWVGLGDGPDGHGRLRHHRDSVPGPSSP